jgi:hypothetical protein
VTWQIETLKRKTAAPNHVGSGDWLGHSWIISLTPFLIVMHNSKGGQQTDGSTERNGLEI